MRDITHKTWSLRTARASALLKMKPGSVAMVRDNTGPKPDIPATARAAGYLAVKNTPGAIPHCHPLPIENVNIDLEYGEGEIRIFVEVQTIYKTGCEIEAMHGASLAALTIYDMLKPVDKDIEISSLKLDMKTGGKTQYKKAVPETLKFAVVVASDSISAGKKEDSAGKGILEKFMEFGLDTGAYVVISDDEDGIVTTVSGFCSQNYDLVIVTGGTGLSPRDNTPEALRRIIEKEIPGIMEAARDYGQQRTPYSMLSRGVAGLSGRTLILGIPGSTNGAKETIDALFPAAFHIFKVLEMGYRHLEFEA